MNKEKIITLLIGTAAVFVIVSAVSFFNFLLGTLEEKPSVQIIQPDFSKEDIETIKKQETEIEKEEEKIFDLYQSLQKVDIYRGGLVTPVGLIQSCEDRKRIPEKCNEEIARITKVLNTEAGITDAYLYIKAGVSRGGSPLGNLTENDSIYFFIDDARQYGGHLLRSRAVWSRVSTNDIELLFDLKSVPFTHLPYDDLTEPDKSPNLIDILNQSSKHFVASFVSTLGYGKIFELKIGYNGGKVELE